MKLGMPTLIELPDIHGTVELCKELGLSFIELNMNMPEFCPEKLAADLVKQLATEKKVEFTLHLPEELDLASFHPAIRRGNSTRCSEAITWAAEAGIRLVNLHLNSGIYFTLPDQKVWIYEKYQEQFLANIEAAFDELSEAARKADVKFCVENCGNFHYSFIREAIDKIMGLDGIYLTWDTGHDAKSGFKERDILLKYENKIGHMHLHDYNGTSDHQLLFSGVIDTGEMLALATRLNLNVVIEVKTVDSLQKSMKLLETRLIFL